MTASQLLYGVLLPALVAGIVLGIAWKIWNRGAQPLLGGTWAGSLAVGLAMLVGFFANESWPGFWPKAAIGWIPFITAAAIVAGVVQNTLPRSLRVRPLLWIAAICWAVWVLTDTPRKSWKGAELIVWYFALVNGAALVTVLVEPLAQRNPGVSMPLSLWAWSAGVSIMLTATGCVSYGQLAAVLPAAMGAATVAAWIKPALSLGRGAASTVIVLGHSFMLCGYFYSELPAWSAVLIAAAPLVLWLPEIPFLSKRPSWVRIVLRMACVALPIALAFVVALPVIFPHKTKSSGPTSEEDYYK